MEECGLLARASGRARTELLVEQGVRVGTGAPQVPHHECWDPKGGDLQTEVHLRQHHGGALCRSDSDCLGWGSLGVLYLSEWSLPRAGKSSDQCGSAQYGDPVASPVINTKDPHTSLVPPLSPPGSSRLPLPPYPDLQTRRSSAPGGSGHACGDEDEDGALQKAH